jgi:hypothetical protein
MAPSALTTANTARVGSSRARPINAVPTDPLPRAPGIAWAGSRVGQGPCEHPAGLGAGCLRQRHSTRVEDRLGAGAVEATRGVGRPQASERVVDRQVQRVADPRVARRGGLWARHAVEEAGRLGGVELDPAVRAGRLVAVRGEVGGNRQLPRGRRVDREDRTRHVRGHRLGGTEVTGAADQDPVGGQHLARRGIGLERGVVVDRPTGQGSADPTPAVRWSRRCSSRSGSTRYGYSCSGSSTAASTGIGPTWLARWHGWENTWSANPTPTAIPVPRTR